MVDVAVVMINYNSAQYTLECIQSVLEKTDDSVSYQIIVVDNNSEDTDYHKLKSQFPTNERCELHRSPINTGFGGGNMIGAEKADARYLLFLNNDTLLINDCLDILTKYMDRNGFVGVCTAQNYDQHGNHVPSFDHNKGFRRLLFGRGFLEKNNPKRYPKRKQEYSQPLDVDWVNGAFLFFRKEAFEEIGGFDKNIFLYWEEMDLCQRLRNNGHRVQLVPEAKILHYLGVSIGKSKAINKESYRSYLYVVRKHYGLLKLLLTKLYLLVVFLLKPKKWYLIPLLFDGDPMKNSIKNLQISHEDA